jgi:hypothetical protein
MWRVACVVYGVICVVCFEVTRAVPGSIVCDCGIRDPIIVCPPSQPIGDWQLVGCRRGLRPMSRYCSGARSRLVGHVGVMIISLVADAMSDAPSPLDVS